MIPLEVEQLEAIDFNPQMLRDLSSIKSWSRVGTPDWILDDSLYEWSSSDKYKVVAIIKGNEYRLIIEFHHGDLIVSHLRKSLLYISEELQRSLTSKSANESSDRVIVRGESKTDDKGDEVKEKKSKISPVTKSSTVTIRPSKRRSKLTTVVDTPFALNESISKGIDEFVIEVFVGASELAANGFESFNPEGVDPLNKPIGYLIRSVNDATHTGRRVYASVSQGNDYDGTVLLVVQLNYANGRVVTSKMESIMDGLTAVSQLTEITQMALDTAIASQKVTTAYSFILNTLKGMSRVTTVSTNPSGPKKVEIASESMLARRVRR